MPDKLGDALIWISIVIYILATIAYAFGKKRWDAVYWSGCALINFAVLMLRKH